MNTSVGTWHVHAGAAYLAPSGPGNHRHLFVVLNDPIIFPGKGNQLCVCVVNFSTPPTNPQVPYDTTCIFPAGSHPFLNHSSFVYYKYAMDLFASDIDANVQNGNYLVQPPDFNATQLNTLIAGLYASSHTPRYFKNLGI